MPKPIKSATLHGSLHHPGVGNLGPKLVTWTDPANKPVSLSISDDKQFLLVGLKSVTIQVPMTNVFYFDDGENYFKDEKTSKL